MYTTIVLQAPRSHTFCLKVWPLILLEINADMTHVAAPRLMVSVHAVNKRRAQAGRQATFMSNVSKYLDDVYLVLSSP